MAAISASTKDLQQQLMQGLFLQKEQEKESVQSSSSHNQAVAKIRTFSQQADDEKANGHWKAGVTYLTSAIELMDSKAVIQEHFSKIERAGYHYNRGNLYSDLGEYHKALEDFDKALQENPVNKEPHYTKGIAYSKLANSAKAIENFKIVIDDRPFTFLGNLATLWLSFEEGRWEDVEENASDLISETNCSLDQCQALRMRGIAKYQLGAQDTSYYEGALHDLEKAIESTPAACLFLCRELYFLHACICRTLKKPEAEEEKAFRLLRKLDRSLPKNFSEPDLPIVDLMLRALIPGEPTRNEALAALGDIYQNGQHGFQKDPARAECYYSMGAEVPSDRAMLPRAKMYYEMKNYSQVKRYCEMILTKEQHFEKKEAATLLGRMYQQGEVAENDEYDMLRAQQYFEQAISLTNAPHAQYYLGEMYCQGKARLHLLYGIADYQRAFTLFEAAHEALPEEPLFAYTLGKCYYNPLNHSSKETGVKPDYAKAYALFSSAERNGYKSADLYQSLSLMSYHGQGIEKPDYRVADKYAELARKWEMRTAETRYYQGLTHVFGHSRFLENLLPIQNLDASIKSLNDESLKTHAYAQSLLKSTYTKKAQTKEAESIRVPELSAHRNLQLSVAANDDGKIVRIFKDVIYGGMHIEIGSIERAAITWDKTRYEPNWKSSSACRIAITQNAPLQIVRTVTFNNNLYYSVGNLNDQNEITWGAEVSESSIIEPSIAINRDRQVMQTYRSTSRNDISYRLGRLEDQRITWITPGLMPASNQYHSHFALRGNCVVVVAESGSEPKSQRCLKTLVGTIANTTISWGSWLEEGPKITHNPQVAFQTDEQLLIVAEGTDGELIYSQRSVNLAAKTIAFATPDKKWIPYNIGYVPALASARDGIVEFHELDTSQDGKNPEIGRHTEFPFFEAVPE